MPIHEGLMGKRLARNRLSLPEQSRAAAHSVPALEGLLRKGAARNRAEDGQIGLAGHIQLEASFGYPCWKP